MESRAGGRRGVPGVGRSVRKVSGVRGIGAHGLRTVAFLMCLVAALAAGWAFATNYVYDANGRLVVVTNDAGESARYFYDELGNLTHIQRLAAGDLAIFGFSPSRGAPGVQVRVQGHGFSPTPSSNAVTFNGVPATVSTATASELVTTVPAGATTGQVAVTVGASTALSASPFVVDETLQPPVIHTVSPTIGAIGTPITVTGESLAPIPNQTDVRLNRRSAHPSATTNVEVVFPIPPQTGSGKVGVMTPYGTATSVQDVVVVPAGVDPATVVQHKRLVLDAPAEGFATAATGESAAALFDGVSGEHVTAVFSGISVASIVYSLYGADNALVVSGTVTASSPAILLPRLPATGTYLLLMKPATGPATWSVALERDKAITLGGAPLEVQTSIAGRQTRLQFSATAGQHLGLGISDLVVNDSSYVYAYVYGPDSSYLEGAYCYSGNSGCGLNLSITATGVHSVVVHPVDVSQTMSFKTTLSTDVVGTLSPDVPVSLNLPRRGQNGRLTFAGTAGGTVALQVAGLTTVPADRYVYYTVYRPDGTLLTSTHTTSSATLNLANLPVAGNYTVFVDPANGEAATAQMTLSTGTTGGEEVDGAGGEYTTTIPGQNAYLTFSATAGQRLGLGISDLVVNDSGYAYVYVGNPDGSYLADAYCYASNGGCGLNLSITATGVYSVVIHAVDVSQTMSFKTTLSTDVAGTLTPDVPVSLNLSRRGQNGRFTFVGTAGGTVALQVAGQATVPMGRNVYYTVYKPDGTVLTSTYTTSAATLNLANLPVTGNYLVFVDPYYGETGTAQVTLATQ